MKNKRLWVNVFSAVMSYGLLLVFSIVSSKLVLVEYGSETNGLLSSVNQLFSYIALLEAGIGTATIQALYRPLADKDTKGTGNVLTASRYYYHACTKWYALCVIVLSFVWPILLETDISYWTIWSVIFFQGIAGVISFWYTATVVNLLVASGRNYVNNHIHIIATLITYVLKIVICLTNANIVFISLSMVGINALKCIAYHFYLRKYYPICFSKCSPDKTLLQQKNSFLVHEISGVVFSSTDTIMLSLFCGLREASIYAVYSLVLNALRTIIGQVFNSTSYVLGKSYSHNRDEYYKTHDGFNRVYVCGTFIVFTVAYLMLLPFLRIYTYGVNDANYLDSNLPLLFVLIELLSSCRIVDNQLIKIALHAKQTINRSITEAAINLIVSIVAVQFVGIYGVLIGTVVALMYRSNDIIRYANRNILMRKPTKEYFLYISNFCVFACFVIGNGFITLETSTYLQLFGMACVVGVVVLGVFGAVNWIVYKLQQKR